jgi:hypothetical protein
MRFTVQAHRFDLCRGFQQKPRISLAIQTLPMTEKLFIKGPAIRGSFIIAA